MHFNHSHFAMTALMAGGERTKLIADTFGLNIETRVLLARIWVPQLLSNNG